MHTPWATPATSLEVNLHKGLDGLIDFSPVAQGSPRLGRADRLCSGYPDAQDLYFTAIDVQIDLPSKDVQGVWICNQKKMGKCLAV